MDITAGLQKQVTLLWCKECGRYLQPPKHWVTASPESKELLTFCIKRLKGLQKVPNRDGSADMHLKVYASCAPHETIVRSASSAC